MRGMVAAAVLVLALPGAAQEAAGPKAAAAADDAALARARAEFESGAAAYDAGRYGEARAHYARAIERLAGAAPAAAAARGDLEIRLQRATAWSHAQEGNADGFRGANRAAWKLVVAAGGNAAEEQHLEGAGACCAQRIADPDARIEFLRGWRRDLAALVPNPLPPTWPVARLRRQVGRVWHEEAIAEERAGRLADAAETLRRALAYRYDAKDVLGTAWSAQHRFGVLLALRRDEEAAAQFGHTLNLLAEGAGLTAECALCKSLEGWLAERVEAGEHARAVALLVAIRRTGALGALGLTTLPAGRLLQIEWDLRCAGGTPEPADAEFLARGLLASGDAEDQPAWAYLGAAILAERALGGDTPRPDAAEAHATAALAAAKALQDPERAARSQLLLARARLAAGDGPGAETVARAVLTAYEAEGADSWIRESARRLGAAAAANAANDEWTARYAFDGKVPERRGAPGHTWLGADIAVFGRAVAQCEGDGAVLTITRRGRQLFLRSPFLVGTQAVEWGWHLKYVNATGILLAILGPEVAVVGQRLEPNAPAARGPAPAAADGGLDLDSLRGVPLPLLAPRVVLRDGETAFVNRFLRLHR